MSQTQVPLTRTPFKSAIQMLVYNHFAICEYTRRNSNNSRSSCASQKGTNNSQVAYPPMHLQFLHLFITPKTITKNKHTEIPHIFFCGQKPKEGNLIL